MHLSFLGVTYAAFIFINPQSNFCSTFCIPQFQLADVEQRH